LSRAARGTAAEVALKRLELSVGTNVAPESSEATGKFMKKLLIVVISLICASSLHAQDQQPSAVKLKADAQRVVSSISSDKTKSRIYCEISDLGTQIDQQKDRTKAEALLQKMDELEKQLGPEYVAFIEATKDVDPNSKDGQDIVSLFDELDAACPD
jgi:hypothetical protein